jgi:hypothetical protein
MVETGLTDMAEENVKLTFKEEGEPSGLAMMLLQYFEQNLHDFGYKNDQARRLVGKVAIEATEGDVAVSLHFKENEIEISEGRLPDADMFVRGSIFDITELATGETGGALGKIVSGRLKIKSAWKHPLFAYRVFGFMNLPAEMKAGSESARSSIKWKLAAAGAAALLALAAFLVLR